MNCRLDKDDLIRLVKGTHVGYDAMGIHAVAANGTFAASHGRWDWDYSAFEGEEYTEADMWNLYKELMSYV